MSEGIDFSWARPGGAAIKAAGKEFVMRYLYPDGQGGKGLDADEVADYRANGLLIGVVYESSATRALSGFAAGVADANTAAGQLGALGMAGTPVYFGVDFDVTDQQAAVNDYINGAASVLTFAGTGVYGEFSVVEACVGTSCAYGWQTYAWSGRAVSSKAAVYQYLNGQTLNGGGVDYCRNLKDDFGAFGGTAPASSGLMQNRTSLSIAEIQHLLNAAGASLAEDGTNGPLTTAALGAFQSSHGLTADLIVGPLTLAALQGGATPTPTSAPASAALLSVDGSWGTLTTTAEQVALGVNADGIRGPVTISAEQTRTGAGVDGIDGPDTRAHLQEHLAALGYYHGAIDSIVGPATVTALQQALNAGAF
jgi:peptidoglycan hydrolase-like protein with peptidoglycan-binding domain